VESFGGWGGPMSSSGRLSAEMMMMMISEIRLVLILTKSVCESLIVTYEFLFFIQFYSVTSPLWY
jgi:hypothetical protein